MNKGTGSITAVGAAMLIAAHQLIDGENKLLEDQIIIKLLGPEVPEYIRVNKDRFYQQDAMALRSHIVLRSRYAEDCLKQAYKKGVRQFIILGAGMDTFAYRQPAWARDIKIIEVDHPDSQVDKMKNLMSAGIAIPENLSFVSVDFEIDDLSTILSQSIISLNEPIFITCLGVLVYLSRNCVDKIFQFAGSFPVKSEFVFTASQKDDKSGLSTTAIRAAMAGEPWITYFDKSELIKQLKGCGFNDVSYLTSEQAAQLYFTNYNMRLLPSKRSTLVRAVI
jgi:methyltransferase (TIGR00027 family)